MTVGDLKKKIAIMPDDWPVLGPSSDHSYRPLEATVEIVEKSGREYFEPDNVRTDVLGPNQKQALVIS